LGGPNKKNTVTSHPKGGIGEFLRGGKKKKNGGKMGAAQTKPKPKNQNIFPGKRTIQNKKKKR